MSCVICYHPNLTTIYKLDDFPISMATVPVDYSEPYEVESLDYCTCNACGQLQIRNKIPLYKLYALNHNTEIVGRTWQEHFEAFAKFLKLNNVHKNVLEIGDPSAKIAQIYCKQVRNWDIIEPNPARRNFNNVHFIKGFFSNRSPDLEGRVYDTVVHSHVLEHAYDLVSFLNDCKFFLRRPNGKVVFSVPNMDAILEDSIFPVNTVNFEHTTFLGIDLIRYIVIAAGLEIDKIQEFGRHSYFVSCRFSTTRNYEAPPIEKNQAILRKFNDNNERCIRYITDVVVPRVRDTQLMNRLPWLDHRTIYLYGAHIKSTFIWNYLKLFGCSSAIHGILDNSTAKQGQKLYGIQHPTEEIVIQSPEVIRDDKNPLILVSHMGLYAEEIKNQLRKINPNLEFV